MNTIIVVFTLAVAYLAIKTLWRSGLTKSQISRLNEYDPPGYVVFKAIIFVVAGFILAAFMRTYIPMIEVEVSEKQLVSIERADGVDGIFVLASGGFSSKTYYNMMVKKENGAVSPYSIRVSSMVEIIESEELEDTGSWVQVYEMRDPDHFLRSWAIGGREFLIAERLRVPKGTVKINWEVN